MQQLNEVYDYIDMHNQPWAIFDKLLRIDTRDYPEVAVHEALLNSLVHRDYAFRASILVSIYTDRMEFVSIGGLLPGIVLDDIMMGLSVCRNQNPANMFYRLQLIEAYGTGMRKIMGVYANTVKKSVVESTNHAFRIVLPNINSDIAIRKNTSLDNNESRVLEFARSNGAVTRADVGKAWNQCFNCIPSVKMHC